MKFRLIANPTFEAEDIDDAFDKLAKHFTLDGEGGLPDDDLIETGEIRIKPVGGGPDQLSQHVVEPDTKPPGVPWNGS